MRPGHNTDAVRAHYAALAPSYDQKANRACRRAYKNLIRRTLGDCQRVLELGAGSSPLLEVVSAPLGVACDISQAMLAARHTAADAPRAVADGAALPFRDHAFDGVFSINVLEHAPNPAAFLAESARVLTPGGWMLAVTPNGDLAWLLDLLERLHLKLPEGPHQFLGTQALASLAGSTFEIAEHSAFLAIPAGPDGLVRFFDRVAGGRGLFQYILLRRRHAPPEVVG